MGRRALNAVASHCPRCGSEYRPGYDTCSDCLVPLVPGPAPAVLDEPAPRDEDDPGEDPAVVVRLPWEEAWLLAGRLRAEGIAARVHPEDYSSAYGRLLHTVFDVVVRQRDLERARGIAAAP